MKKINPSLKITYLIAFILGNTFLFGQDIQLSDCLKEARLNNALHKNAEYILASVDLKLKNIQSNWYPSVDLKGQVSWQNDVTHIELDNPMFQIPIAPKDQYKMHLDVSQMIYDGGITKAQKSIERARGSLSVAELEVQIYQIRDRVTQSYFLILILNEQEKQLAAQIEVLKERFKAINGAVSSGALLQSDADLIEVEILTLQQKSIELDEGINKAYGILSELVGRTIQSNQTLEIPNASIPSVESSLRPEDEMYQQNLALIEENSKLISRTRLPKLLGFGQVGYGNPGYNMLLDSFEPYYMAGIRMQWKVFDWNNAKRQKSMMDYSSKMVQSQQETFHQNRRIQLLSAESKLQTIDRLVEKDKQIINLRKKVTQANESKLNNGTITSAEYIASVYAESNAILNQKIHKIQKIQTMIEYTTIIGVKE